MDAVATQQDAHDLWPDSAGIPSDTLDALLAAAWESCQEYLPAEQVAAVDGQTVPVPARWVQANVLQARDLWTAYRQDGGVIGFDTFAVTIRPLTGTVRGLLRPPRGVPMVG